MKVMVYALALRSRKHGTFALDVFETEERRNDAIRNFANDEGFPGDAAQADMAEVDAFLETTDADVDTEDVMVEVLL